MCRRVASTMVPVRATTTSAGGEGSDAVAGALIQGRTWVCGCSSTYWTEEVTRANRGLCHVAECKALLYVQLRECTSSFVRIVYPFVGAPILKRRFALSKCSSLVGRSRRSGPHRG